MTCSLPTSLKQRFPFRLGTTSFILHDDYLPNVQYLAPIVDDIELLFFEPLSDDDYKRGWVQHAKDIQEAQELSFSIHLPAELCLGSTNEEKRKEGLEICKKVVEFTRPLNCSAYVLHAHGDERKRFTDAELRCMADSFVELGEVCGGIEKLCIENVDTSHDLMADSLLASGASICYDVGHALLNGQNVRDELSRWMERIRVIHLHGVKGGKDHHPLSEFDSDLLSDIVQGYMNTHNSAERVLTLEYFKEQRLQDSIPYMERFLT